MRLKYLQIIYGHDLFLVTLTILYFSIEILRFFIENFLYSSTNIGRLLRNSRSGDSVVAFSKIHFYPHNTQSIFFTYLVICSLITFCLRFNKQTALVYCVQLELILAVCPSPFSDRFNDKFVIHTGNIAL